MKDDNISNDLEKDFKEQLKTFVDDTSDESTYDHFKPRNEKVLVKLFKFTPKVKTKALGESSILTKSALDGTWKPSVTAKNEKVFPICRVISKGLMADDDIVVGGIYTVPISEVTGEDWNKEFMWLVQNFGQQGKHGSMTKLPEGMRQRMPKLEINWDRYKFSLPDRLGAETDDDLLVYLVPSLKLESEFTPKV